MNKSNRCQIFYVDIYGKRKDKYRFLLENTIKTVEWQELQPNTPYYLFIPQDQTMRKVYEKGWKVTDIFPVQSTGVTTHRDHFVIDFELARLNERINNFIDLNIKDDEIARRYNLESNKDWNLSEKRKALANDAKYATSFTHILYRPFDIRAYFHNDNAVDRTRNEVMRHMIAGENLGLVTVRQITSGSFNHATISQFTVETKTCSHDRGTIFFPLHLYKPKNDLLGSVEERIENLSPAFRKFIDAKYGKAYSPEEILGYIYAVLHSPAYRSKYVEFLKIDFPRIPFVDDSNIFEQLASIGFGLVQAHLLKTIPNFPDSEINKGNMVVEKPLYVAETQRLYINKEQYFSAVTQEIWEFHIGGYQVLDKYLKSRRGRTLSLDEIENIQNIVKVINFTLTQMQEIDAVWKEP